MSTLAKLGLIAAIFLVGLSTGWVSHGWKYDADQLDAANKLAVAVAENDRLKTELGVKHEAERKQIADLAATLAAGRVRMPKGCITPNGPSGSANPTPGTGTLSNDPEEALNRFTRGMGQLTKEADEMLATCRVVMEWAKAR